MASTADVPDDIASETFGTNRLTTHELLSSDRPRRNGRWIAFELNANEASALAQYCLHHNISSGQLPTPVQLGDLLRTLWPRIHGRHARLELVLATAIAKWIALRRREALMDPSRKPSGKKGVDPSALLAGFVELRVQDNTTTTTIGASAASAASAAQQSGDGPVQYTVATPAQYPGAGPAQYPVTGQRYAYPPVTAQRYRPPISISTQHRALEESSSQQQQQQQHPGLPATRHQHGPSQQVNPPRQRPSQEASYPPLGEYVPHQGPAYHGHHHSKQEASSPQPHSRHQFQPPPTQHSQAHHEPNTASLQRRSLPAAASQSGDYHVSTQHQSQFQDVRNISQTRQQGTHALSHRRRDLQATHSGGGYNSTPHQPQPHDPARGQAHPGRFHATSDDPSAGAPHTTHLDTSKDTHALPSAALAPADCRRQSISDADASIDPDSHVHALIADLERHLGRTLFVTPAMLDDVDTVTRKLNETVRRVEEELEWWRDVVVEMEMGGSGEGSDR